MKIYRYLSLMIIALGVSVYVFAQQRSLKIYFSENVNGATSPQILVTDENSDYNLPADLSVSSEGVVWANKALYQQDVSDRVIADFVTDKDGNVDKTESNLKLTFKNFPYEVNIIQWNTMNDLFSDNITDFFNNISVTTKCVPVSGSGFTYTHEHWDLNLFTHNITFGQADIPWQDGAVLNGLKSFEISEKNVIKIGIGPFTSYSQQAELKERYRTFIKAGWNGVTGEESNINDSDDENWAFKVKFTLPDVRIRCRNIATNSVDNNIIVQEEGVHKLEGYIYAHPGAVQGKIDDPQDPDDFHFEYTVADADKNKIEIEQYTGIVTKVKMAGDVHITVTLMYGNIKICSYTQTMHVIAPVDMKNYIVTLDHNKGNGDPEQITAIYNQPMPENIGLVAPTRTGYEFTGYSRSGTYYYDANLKSVRNFDRQQDYTLYANWKARATTVTLDPQGGQNGTSQVTATYGKAMPTGENIVAPTRTGYTFGGYFSSANGKGTQYYNVDMTSKRSWNKEAEEMTLYAKWTPDVFVTDIAISEATMDLWVSKTKTLTANVAPANATITAVTWTSSNTAVATVSSKGVVKAIAKGTATITCKATDGSGISKTCAVTVKQQVTSIDFGYETLSVTCGKTKTLTPKIYPSNANVKTLTWKSKNTSVARVSSEGVLTAVAPGTAQIICTATDGFKKADTITVEVVPLKITDTKPTIAEGTYGIGGISYSRTLTAGKYASFCMPYTVNLNDYTEEFSKVFVPMGMTFLKTNGTLVVAFKKVSLTETISAGKPFVALAAKSGSVSIVNDVKKIVTTLTDPTPTNIDVYNWNGSNGFFEFNPDVTTKIGGTYSKLTGLDSEKYYTVSTSGTMSKSASISPYRIYVYKDDNNSNAKITEIIFSFDEDEMATGIEEHQIKNDESPVYYNLSGQRINKSNAQKGVYIKNGKKYAK